MENANFILLVLILTLTIVVQKFFGSNCSTDVEYKNLK
jgi:hypothetical protein